MAFTNNVMIVRHKLLATLVKLWKEEALVEKIDRLPIELSPRKSKVMGRCCIHKERAVWKYKSLPLLGFDMNDETDELTPLSTYAAAALERKSLKENIMCVVDEACSSCVKTNYQITNLCRGCVARSCAASCPKGAIEFDPETSQGRIHKSMCISCGKCYDNCPYHAIVHIPVPCEEACPVGAITKDENGVEHIDESKCIYCGKCLNSCPFGAIFEISQVFDILQSIRRGEEVVAMVAPAFLAQYDAPTEQVYGAIKAIGFSHIVEVAQGAMITTEKEAEELIEKIEEGQPFMTTSCCPAYIEMAEKHVPYLKKYISDTRSPMYYTAQIAKEKYPDACEQDKYAQLHWLDSVLNKAKEDWVLVVGHHPIYAETSKNMSERVCMQNEVNGILLERDNVDMYLCGHIHNFQHIRYENNTIDYIVNSSASLSRAVKPIAGTHFCSSEPGFSVIAANKKELSLYMIDKNGNVLHTVNKHK